MMLRVHRGFILECLDMFGLEKTCELFGITKLETIESIINTGEDNKPRKLSKVDKAEARSMIALAGYEALHERLTDHEKPKKIVIEYFKGYLVREVEREETDQLKL